MNHQNFHTAYEPHTMHTHTPCHRDHFTPTWEGSEEASFALLACHYLPPRESRRMSTAGGFTLPLRRQAHATQGHHPTLPHHTQRTSQHHTHWPLHAHATHTTPKALLPPTPTFLAFTPAYPQEGGT